MKNPTVYFVHCIDTEGPLHEPLSATFERLEEMFGINIEATKENLNKLQNDQIKIPNSKISTSDVFSEDLLDYNDTWDKIDDMLSESLSSEYRNLQKDSFGGGWIYNWFCMDHVGFEDNPRRRDLGINKIYDHYVDKLRQHNSHQDGVYFHFHPIPFTKEAHHPATHFFSHSPEIYRTLSRKIIDRKYFPCVFRPGFHSTRPDSHWFLEQFIPFEFANQATKHNSSESFNDLKGGRFGDWRRAPKTWEPYHPSHDDYQSKGKCRRWIARSLNLGTRSRIMTVDDVRDAFNEAQEGKPVILSFNDHDFRDIRPDVDDARLMISAVASEFPNVNFKFSDAREAFRSALSLTKRDKLKFKVYFSSNTMHVRSNHEIFGPQPFFCIKSIDGEYFHDNFDFQEQFRSWSYTFDSITFPIEKLENIAFASNDDYGNTTVVHVDPRDLSKKEYYI